MSACPTREPAIERHGRPCVQCRTSASLPLCSSRSVLPSSRRRYFSPNLQNGNCVRAVAADVHDAQPQNLALLRQSICFVCLAIRASPFSSIVLQHNRPPSFEHPFRMMQNTFAQTQFLHFSSMIPDLEIGRRYEDRTRTSNRGSIRHHWTAQSSSEAHAAPLVGVRRYEMDL